MPGGLGLPLPSEWTTEDIVLRALGGDGIVRLMTSSNNVLLRFGGADRLCENMGLELPIVPETRSKGAHFGQRCRRDVDAAGIATGMLKL